MKSNIIHLHRRQNTQINNGISIETDDSGNPVQVVGDPRENGRKRRETVGEAVAGEADEDVAAGEAGGDGERAARVAVADGLGAVGAAVHAEHVGVDLEAGRRGRLHAAHVADDEELGLKDDRRRRIL